MEKGFIEVESLEVKSCNHLPIPNMGTSFSSANNKETTEQKVLPQICCRSYDESKMHISENKVNYNDQKSNVGLELTNKDHKQLSEMFGSSCVNQIMPPSMDPFNSKSPFPKNDHPSLFVHENFFKKHGCQNSQAVCRINAHSKIQTSQSFKALTTKSLLNSQCITEIFNKSQILSETHELRNNNVKTKISEFQQSSIPNRNKVISGASMPNVDSNQFVSRRSFEFFGTSKVYKFNSERLTQFYELGYESISESDDEEDEDEAKQISFSSAKKPITYPLFNAGNTTVVQDSNAILSIEYDLKKLVLHKIASELLSTERTYVEILHLLDQIFAFRVDQENRVHNMFPQETVSHMFTNLKSLYKLHHDFLLPQLEERMNNWEKEHRIGDIMKNFAPFLKMYTEYVKNYDNSMNLFNLWYQKSPRFAQIINELHHLKECKFLSLQHHMLTPVQRVPRYQLLLKDYLKKLPDDSVDKDDAEKALELVSIAANHSNETIKKIDKFKKLLEIQEMISGTVDLVSPSRELLKEGKIVKISARSGDHQDRYLFLFSDLVLLCSQRLIPNKVVSGHSFRARVRLNVEDLLVEEGDNLETANTFYIRTTGRIIELYTLTFEEKTEWIQALNCAVAELLQKKSSLKIGKLEAKIDCVSELGTKAPEFLKLDSVTHCMSCDGLFSTFVFRRKHHCHACGIVVCNKCLPKKVQLPYEGQKIGKVCNKCYDVLVKDLTCDKLRNFANPQKQKGILDVNPNDPSIVSGYLQLKARSRFWVRRWFTLHDDFVLYSFNSHLDEMALTSMPVPGYMVGMPDAMDNVDGREHVFKLFYKKKMYFFQTSGQLELQRWFTAMEKASKAESFS